MIYKPQFITLGKVFKNRQEPLKNPFPCFFNNKERFLGLEVEKQTIQKVKMNLVFEFNILMTNKNLR